MATSKPKPKAKSLQQPLRVKLINASGEEIEGIVPGRRFPKEDPTLAIARELSKHKHLKPTPIP